MVAAPILGVTISEDQQIGDVIVTRRNPARLELTAGDLVQQYLNARGFAYTVVQTSTLQEAEEQGVAALDTATTQLRAIGFYSYPTLNGELRSFDWRQTQARVHLSPVTFVGSLLGGRWWLRNTADVPCDATLNLDALDVPHSSELGNAVPPRRLLGRALREWRLAADAHDEVTRVTHLWRAMECYAAGVRVPAMFPRATRDAIRQAALSRPDLTSEQQERIDELMARLNEAPLLAKIRRALELDGVSILGAEFDALAATRSLRNNIEHGRTLTPSQHRQVDVATAVANRILVAALVNLTRPSGPTNSASPPPRHV